MVTVLITAPEDELELLDELELDELLLELFEELELLDEDELEEELELDELELDVEPPQLFCTP